MKLTLAASLVLALLAGSPRFRMGSGDPSGGCDPEGYYVNSTSGARFVCNGGAWEALPSGSGAPADAQYVVGAAHAGLSAEIVATTAGLALLDDADAAAQRTTLGLGTLATQSGTFSGTSSGTNTGDQTITLTGNVTGSGTGSFAATIANDAVTYAKIQNVTDARLLGRSAGSAGDAMEITVGSGLSLSAGNLTATGGGGGPTITRKSADQSSTSTTFADVTGLTFAVSASTSYNFVCHLSYLSAATTTALQVSINGPASPTAVRFTVETSTSATARHNASQSAYDANTNPGSALTTALPVMVAGTIENGSNSGTLALRMRTEVNASSVTIQRGSYCVWY